MTQRGRKSAASMSVVTAMPARPNPSKYLVGEERVIWSQVVGSHPGGWITKDAMPVLVQYCKHVVRSLRVSQLIEELEQSEEFEVDRWSKLLDIQEKQTRTILACARSMRITHQARIRADSAQARPDPNRRKPWE